MRLSEERVELACQNLSIHPGEPRKEDAILKDRYIQMKNIPLVTHRFEEHKKVLFWGKIGSHYLSFSGGWKMYIEWRKFYVQLKCWHSVIIHFFKILFYCELLTWEFYTLLLSIKWLVFSKQEPAWLQCFQNRTNYFFHLKIINMCTVLFTQLFPFGINHFWWDVTTICYFGRVFR